MNTLGGTTLRRFSSILRTIIPLTVVALALWYGFGEYRAGRLALPGLPARQAATSTTLPATRAAKPAKPTTTPRAINPATGPMATTAPVTAAQPSLDTDPALGLDPARAGVLNRYADGDYARTVADARAYLADHPTDPLVSLYRGDALQRQVGKPTVTIGVSVPTTGGNAQSGEAILQGVNLAVSNVNRAGGVRGRRVLVLVRNDAQDRAQAVEAASRFVAQPEVLAVIGPVGSSATLAAADVYNSAGLSQVAPTATDDRVAQAGDYTFRMAPGNTPQGRALARLAQRSGFTRVPVYSNPKDEYSKSLAAAFVVEATSLGVSAPSFTYQPGGLPAQDGFDTFTDSPKPNAAFISGTYDDVTRLAQAFRKRGLKVPLLSGDAAYSQKLLQVGGAAVEGLTLVSFFHATSSVGSTAAFTAQFEAVYAGGTPNARAAQAFDATRAVLEAIRRAPTLSRDGIQAGLKAITPAKPTPGVTAPIGFVNNGAAGRPFIVIKVKNGQLLATDVVK